MKQIDLSNLKRQIGFYPHDQQRAILKNQNRFTVNKQYSVKIGTPDEHKSVETIADREILIEARDVYQAHKSAMFKTRSLEEVLTIHHGEKLVYGINVGFNPS